MSPVRTTWSSNIPGSQDAMSEPLVPNPVLVEQLRDLHLPESPPWWSMAIGWWCLLTIGSLLFIALGIKAYRIRRRKTAESRLAENLDLAHLNWTRHNKASEYLREIGLLLRAYAVNNHGRQTVAKLTGSEWISWLEHQQRDCLSVSTCLALSQECYQQTPTTNINQLHAELQQWVKTVSVSPVDNTSMSMDAPGNHHA